MLDQRRLPTDEVYVECERPEQVAEAIRNMTIRGSGCYGDCPGGDEGAG